MASSRKPVGNDYAPLLDGFIWKLRPVRGRGRRKNLLARPRSWFQENAELISGGNCGRTPVSPPAGSLLFGRSVVFVAFAIHGWSLIPNALIAAKFVFCECAKKRETAPNVSTISPPKKRPGPRRLRVAAKCVPGPNSSAHFPQTARKRKTETAPPKKSPGSRRPV